MNHVKGVKWLAAWKQFAQKYLQHQFNTHLSFKPTLYSHFPFFLYFCNLKISTMSWSSVSPPLSVQRPNFLPYWIRSPRLFLRLWQLAICIQFNWKAIHQKKNLESIYLWLIWQQDFHAILSKKVILRDICFARCPSTSTFIWPLRDKAALLQGITCWSIWENAKKGDEADSSTLFFIQAEQSHTCPFFGAANVGNYDDEF